MKKLCFIALVVLTFAFCGGTGYREIDRGYLVTAIGVLQENDNTTILIEAMSSSDVSDKKSERVVLSGSGKNAKNAYKNLRASLVKPLYFEHLGTVVFEADTGADLDLLEEIPNLNYGVYVIKTDNVKTLFENATPNGALGYDVIGLVKNYNKESENKVLCQLYTVKRSGRLPTVNLKDGRLVIENEGQ